MKAHSTKKPGSIHHLTPGMLMFGVLVLGVVSGIFLNAVLESVPVSAVSSSSGLPVEVRQETLKYPWLSDGLSEGQAATYFERQDALENAYLESSKFAGKKTIDPETDYGLTHGVGTRSRPEGSEAERQGSVNEPETDYGLTRGARSSGTAKPQDETGDFTPY